MKVLWLCNIMIPEISIKLNKRIEYGGGWLIGLSEGLLKHTSIELCICCPIYNQNRIVEGRTNSFKFVCFPKKKVNPQIYDYEVELHFKSIIQNFKPDIIHIFGTEYPHSLAMTIVCKQLGIINKVIISIQGLVSICYKHFMADLPFHIFYRSTLRDIIRKDSLVQKRKEFFKRGQYEIESIRNAKHIIGRTDWDKACTYRINPDAKYYACNEILRNQFYLNSWDINKCERHSVFVSQGSYPIKGLHLMLEAMPDVLQKFPDAHLYVAGTDITKQKTLREKLRITNYGLYINQLIKKYRLQDSITFTGPLSEEEMCKRYLKSNVFVSPSVIENSPNSVGEAMLLGVPTISSDVGGVKHLIKHNLDGFIYQHNAPYMLAYYICLLFEDEKRTIEFSHQAKINSSFIYNRENNIRTLYEIYKKVDMV